MMQSSTRFATWKKEYENCLKFKANTETLTAEEISASYQQIECYVYIFYVIFLCSEYAWRVIREFTFSFMHLSAVPATRKGSSRTEITLRQNRKFLSLPPPPSTYPSVTHLLSPWHQCNVTPNFRRPQHPYWRYVISEWHASGHTP